MMSWIDTATAGIFIPLDTYSNHYILHVPLLGKDFLSTFLEQVYNAALANCIFCINELCINELCINKLCNNELCINELLPRTTNQ